MGALSRHEAAARAAALDARAKQIKSQMYRLKDELRQVSQERDRLLQAVGIRITHTRSQEDRHGGNNSTTIPQDREVRTSRAA